MRIESSITGRQFRFYDDDGVYLGSVRAEVRGPRVILDSLDSKHFYKNFHKIWEFINVTNGTSIWHAHVTPEHFLAMCKMAQGTQYRVELLAVEEHAGRPDMHWIEVTSVEK